jgi:hypothetical protein
MKYKAIIFDVDGTLVPNRRDGMPSKKVIKAINASSKKFNIGIATARSYWQVAHILDVLHFSAPCIITGGAQIIDPKTRKTFVERNISKEDIEKVAIIAKKMGIGLTVANREGEIVYKKNEIPDNPLDVYTNSINLEKADEFIKNISHISSISSHKASAWEDNTKICVTISNPKSSKQDAILEVANLLNIKTDEIVGVGEGYNDFPLLMACGFKVAMGNAIPDVIEIADLVVGSVDRDGVLEVLSKFVI